MMDVTKTIAAMVAFILWAAAGGAAAADDAGAAALENGGLRLELGRAPAPFIERLVHKGSGKAVIDHPANKNLFSISVLKEDGGLATIESGQAGESSLRADAGAFTIRYAKFPGADLTAEVRVTCDERTPQSLWSIRVENGTGRPIKSVRFPQVLAVPAIGEAKDDLLVLPALAGTLIENPAESWRDGQSVTLRYPGDLSAQFLAYQDRSAGLYIAGTDTNGHPMSLTVLKQPDGYRCWHEFTPVEAGRVWRSPYPVALGVTQGTWCDTADQYKQWALRQWWCAKRLTERTDIPAWWKAGPDVHVCEVRTYDNVRRCTGSFYPQLAEYLGAWRAKIGGPVVAMLAGWENHRRWTAGDYFPAFDATNAAPVLARLRADGVRPFFYLSGLYYTFRNEGRDGGEIPTAQQFAAAYILDEKSHQSKEYVLDESNPGGDWKRHSYQFCAAAPQTQKFFLETIDRAHDLGVDVLQMDQTTSGAGDACHATGHGHAPGVGLYQSTAFWKLLDAMRAHGKERTPDFVLLHEEPHEQLIPHLDGFHVREYYEKRWYRGQPGAVGIPLFDYLYHEFAIGYGGDSAGLSKDNNRVDVRAHAVNLVTGRTPGGSVWSSPASMYEAHPDQIAILRNHCRLLQTRAQEFLMFGRMLHPFELAVPKLPFGIAVRRGDKWVREDVPTPAILTSSWQAPDGRIGHLFVNIAETRQPLQVVLDARNAPAAKAYDAEICRSTVGASFGPLWQNVGLPKGFTAELEPQEAVFIELRNRAK